MANHHHHRHRTPRYTTAAATPAAATSDEPSMDDDDGRSVALIFSGVRGFFTFLVEAEMPAGYTPARVPICVTDCCLC